LPPDGLNLRPLPVTCSPPAPPAEPEPVRAAGTSSAGCGQTQYVGPLLCSEPRRRSPGGVLREPAGLSGGGQGDVDSRVAQATLEQGLGPGGDAKGTQRCELGRAGRPARELPLAERAHQQDAEAEVVS